MEDQSQQEIVLLGHINGVFGVKGWLKVFSDTEPRENIVRYKIWKIGEGDKRGSPVVNNSPGVVKAPENRKWRDIKLLEGKRHGKNVIVRLEGVETRDQAAELVGSLVAVEKNELPELPSGEYYWSDLIGLSVVSTSGPVLGKVERLMETGANDVLVVSAQDSGTDNGDVESSGENLAQNSAEILIPWVLDHFVLEVDLAARRILVDWQEDY